MNLEKSEQMTNCIYANLKLLEFYCKNHKTESTAILYPLLKITSKIADDLWYLHIQELENADKWVEKYGDWSFFFCRMLPIIRTFISLPAGILKAKKRFFFTMTFLGSLIWCYALVFAGVKFGEHIEDVLPIWHKFDVAIVVICSVLAVVYIYNHIKKLRQS